MTLQFIHAYAIELEGSVSSKRPHLRGDKPGITEKNGVLASRWDRSALRQDPRRRDAS